MYKQIEYRCEWTGHRYHVNLIYNAHWLIRLDRQMVKGKVVETRKQLAYILKRLQYIRTTPKIVQTE